MARERTYQILTWDMDEQRYTPQIGVPEFVTGQLGLRKAVRMLRNLGYTAHRIGDDNDSYTLIQAIPETI